jgi:hypothetical protein
VIIPGSNLLRMALSVQGVQWVLWSQDLGRAINAAGKQVTNYAFPVAVPGSFQPMGRSRQQIQGWDMAKSYATFYASQPMKPVERGLSGDVFAYGGSLWQAVGDVDWFNQDGWDAITLVRTGPYVG